MSKRKGMSSEEKRSKMLEIFYEKREFFTLKEIEKIATKEKGIILQSVKDVLQYLVDEGLVRSDKIGTTVFYWAFPGENITSLEKRISEVNKSIVELEFKTKKLEEEIEKQQENKGDLKLCEQLLQDVEELRKREASINSQIKKYDDINPDVLNNLEDISKRYVNVTNTWLDNVYAIKKWCLSKFNISNTDFDKNFDLPVDMDYLE